MKTYQQFLTEVAKVDTQRFEDSWGGQTIVVKIKDPGKKSAIISVWKEDKNGKELSEPNIFKVGDMAEYGSYNLVYYGPIVSITDKTVTMQHRHAAEGGNQKKYRLSIKEFANRNYDFDEVEVSKRNSETMMYI